MYSNKSIILLQFMINIGNKINCFPFQLTINSNGNPNLKRTTNKFQHKIWKMTIFIYGFLQILVLGFGIWVEISIHSNIPIDHRAQFYMLVPIYLSGIVFSVLTFIFWESIVNLFNSFVLFCERLRKFYG